MRSPRLLLVPLTFALVAAGAFAVPPMPVKKAVIVGASPADVWAAWTTAAGTKAFFAPDAMIEAVPGGPYEIYLDPGAPEGSRGCEGCTVVSVEPPKKLVVTWSFPPSFPELRGKGERGRLSVELIPGSVDGSTLVSLVHDEFPEGEAGEKGRAYFDKAWDVILGRLRERFRHGPIDWSKK